MPTDLLAFACSRTHTNSLPPSPISNVFRHRCKFCRMSVLQYGDAACQVDPIVMPATNAISERSFSALRHLKTWLRSTMHQSRLNWCMLLHVHCEDTDKLDLTALANEFIGRNASRHSEILCNCVFNFNVHNYNILLKSFTSGHAQNHSQEAYLKKKNTGGACPQTPLGGCAHSAQHITAYDVW